MPGKTGTGDISELRLGLAKDVALVPAAENEPASRREDDAAKGDSRGRDVSMLSDEDVGCAGRANAADEGWVLNEGSLFTDGS